MKNEYEIIKIIPIQVGDIYTENTTEQAVNSMKKLHKQGIETCLYSFHNGAVMRSFEIKYMPEVPSSEKLDGAPPQKG